ncbi:hypothetical protein DXG03_001513 [Asterophora parasitica]|uniref:Uncharacterized protein n=1 Tax=Asterophora parasitica TaxID=117018 RepID=A0A9P7K984_9AGAR|nr:hypothetical protein DXG03_001513 [Asterophora parasitica]
MPSRPHPRKLFPSQLSVVTAAKAEYENARLKAGGDCLNDDSDIRVVNHCLLPPNDAAKSRLTARDSEYEPDEHHDKSKVKAFSASASDISETKLQYSKLLSPSTGSASEADQVGGFDVKAQERFDSEFATSLRPSLEPQEQPPPDDAGHFMAPSSDSHSSPGRRLAHEDTLCRRADVLADSGSDVVTPTQHATVTKSNPKGTAKATPEEKEEAYNAILDSELPPRLNLRKRLALALAEQSPDDLDSQLGPGYQFHGTLGLPNPMSNLLYRSGRPGLPLGPFIDSDDVDYDRDFSLESRAAKRRRYYTGDPSGTWQARHPNMSRGRYRRSRFDHEERTLI